MVKNLFKTIIKGQKGFTLIELLAVLAIVSVMAGIVSAGITGQSAKGAKASAKEDGFNTETSAGQFFTDQPREFLSTEEVSLTSTVSGAAVLSVTQEISNKWPETFITEETTGTATTRYFQEFPTSESASAAVLDNVRIVDSDGNSIAGDTFLTTYTAVDFSTLISEGYSNKAPRSVDETTTLESIEFNTFLWLFRKVSTAGESGIDSRTVALFRLTGFQVDDEALKPLSLTYTQIN